MKSSCNGCSLLLLFRQVALDSVLWVPGLPEGTTGGNPKQNKRITPTMSSACTAKEIKALKEEAGRSETAPPVIKKILRKGTEPDPVRGLFAATVWRKSAPILPLKIANAEKQLVFHMMPTRSAIEHDKALERAVIELLSDHTELFKQFSDNPSFHKWLSETIFTATYHQGAEGGSLSVP